MPIDLKKFEGTLPYDSQMYGIYQPLLGWKSEPQSNRLLNGLRFLRQRYLTGLTRTVSPSYTISSTVIDAPAFQLGVAPSTSALQPQSVDGINSLFTQHVLQVVSAAGIDDHDVWKNNPDPAYLLQALQYQKRHE